MNNKNINSENIKKRPDIVAYALKKRHFALLEKLQKGKALTAGEIKELRKHEGEQNPPGVVETQEQLAKVFKVSIRAVQYWAKEGMPKTDKGLYSIKEIHDWHEGRGMARKKHPDSEKEKWETQWRKKKAQQEDIKLKEMMGELIDKKKVEKGRVERIFVIKKALLSFPHEMAPVVAGLDEREILIILTSRIEQIINDFAGQDINAKEEKHTK